MVLYSEVADPEVVVLLPINAMRNAALLPARTSLVLMLDVDMLISADLLPSVTAGCDSSFQINEWCRFTFFSITSNKIPSATGSGTLECR